MKKIIIIVWIPLLTIVSVQAGYPSYNYSVTRPKRYSEKPRIAPGYAQKKQHENEQYKTEHFCMGKNNKTRVLGNRESKSITLALIGMSLMKPSCSATF